LGVLTEDYDKKELGTRGELCHDFRLAEITSVIESKNFVSWL